MHLWTLPREALVRGIGRSVRYDTTKLLILLEPLASFCGHAPSRGTRSATRCTTVDGPQRAARRGFAPRAAPANSQSASTGHRVVDTIAISQISSFRSFAKMAAAH